LSVDASIVFHPDFDCVLEDRQFPDKRIEIKICTCSEMDELYEEFLVHNRIDPSAVTLSQARLIRQRNKTVHKGNEKETEKNLGRTEYTFLPHLKYKSERPFYFNAQSCVSFAYHMIEWTKLPLPKETIQSFYGGILFPILNSVSGNPPVEKIKVSFCCHF
jgi:hypothetical protein